MADGAEAVKHRGGGGEPMRCSGVPQKLAARGCPWCWGGSTPMAAKRRHERHRGGRCTYCDAPTLMRRGEGLGLDRGDWRHRGGTLVTVLGFGDRCVRAVDADRFLAACTAYFSIRAADFRYVPLLELHCLLIPTFVVRWRC